MDTAERIRLDSKKGKVFEHMLKYLEATNAELWPLGGNAATRRLWECRAAFLREGYVLTKRHERGGCWRYTLKPVALRQAELWEDISCRSESFMR